MRSALLISAGLAMAIAGQALAATPPSAGPSNMPSTDAPMQSSTQAQTSQPSSSPTGSSADTSATAGGAAAPAPLSVGEPVKDNTGATIGEVASLSTNAQGLQMAVIKMGNDKFQVSTDKLGVADGAAMINLSQAQINTMLHPPAGGR